MGAALGYYRKALALTRQLTAADPANTQLARDVVVVLFQVGSAARRSADVKLAEQTLTEGIERSEALLALEPKSVMARADLADMLRELGRVESSALKWEAARVVQERALALYEGLALEVVNDPDYLAGRAATAGELGHTYDVRGKHELGCELLTKAHAGWLEMKAAGLLSEADQHEPEQAEEELATCGLKAPPPRK